MYKGAMNMDISSKITKTKEDIKTCSNTINQLSQMLQQNQERLNMLIGKLEAYRELQNELEEA